MPNEIDYLYELRIGVARVRARFTTDGPDVTSFMAQLEAFHMDDWKPVRRYDDYHGRPHLDVLDRWGREYHKEWLDVDRNTALTMAIRDLRDNGERYVDAFLEGAEHGQGTQSHT